MIALEYPTNGGTEEELQNSFVLTHKENGTTKLPVELLMGSGSSTSVDWFSDDNPVEYRKHTFRGKKLGSELSDSVLSGPVKNGTFDGMYLGDYWELPNGDIWRIADFDYMMGGLGVSPDHYHNIVLLSDAAIDFSNVDASYQDNMKVFDSITPDTNGNFDMSTSNFSTILPTMAEEYRKKYFPSLSQEKLTNVSICMPKTINYSSGAVTDVAYQKCVFKIPNMDTFYGKSNLFSSNSLTDPNFRYFKDTIRLAQFSLLTQKKLYHGSYKYDDTLQAFRTSYYWLLDCCNNGLFFVVSAGIIGARYATDTASIRPYMIYFP